MRYHNITKDDMLNGDGLRVVLWVSGCNHKCPECHNSMTWNPDEGLLFDAHAWDEICNELDKEYVSGITFSGGDPLHENNVNEIKDLITIIRKKFPDKTIWLYSGYTYEYLKNSEDEMDKIRLETVEMCDVFCDGPFQKELKDINCQWVGSSNQQVIRFTEKR